MDTYFAVTAPGLEPFTAIELRALFPDREPVPEPGGVTFKGDLSTLSLANLHLRTASRVLARLGNFFRAITFEELQQRAARLPWERFLTPGQPISLRVTCHKSKLYHSDAVARTVSAALTERLGQPSPIAKLDDETDQPPQLVIVRLADDICTVSVDSSGTILHKRGYRQAVAKAPLRETLAAAILMASGWDKVSPLLDPFCGSGTIPIEAALMALGIPPGLNRRFAFMDWSGFDERLWSSVQTPLTINHNPSLTILASDRDAGAIKMSQANAERAGVAEYIEFTCQAVSAVTPPATLRLRSGRGWVVTNPPYGLRVRSGADLRNLYAQFGNVLREKCPGWDVSVLCSDPALLGQMHLELDTSLGLVNGGVHVRLGRGVVEQGPSPARQSHSEN
ncbi:MAG: class I SAM-dependent RNA methyltransferase [Chloroflexi bacterium]|nr:class I SAM-dependent RNA methyltransferase [Chloroflexota bacterium]